MMFHSYNGRMYLKSVRVAPGSTDLGSVMNAKPVALSGWSLFIEGENKGYIAQVSFLIRKSLDFNFSLEIMRENVRHPF